MYDNKFSVYCELSLCLCGFLLFSTTFCFILLLYECLSALDSDSSTNNQRIILFIKYYNY